MEGDWYNFDSTWDMKDWPYFKYFLLDDVHFGRTHNPDKEPATPDCHAMKYNIYQYQNRRITAAQNGDLKPQMIKVFEMVAKEIAMGRHALQVLH